MPRATQCILSKGGCVLASRMSKGSTRSGAEGAVTGGQSKDHRLTSGRDALQHNLGHGGGIDWLADDISKRAGAE
jgi:hypothetical protein